MRAYVLISATAGRALDIVESLQRQNGVVQADVITGEYDIIAQVEAADVGGIGKLVVGSVQNLEGVFKTITCLVVH